MSQNHATGRRHGRRNRWLGWFRAYRFEIAWLAVVAFGMFLLLERMQLRRSTLNWLRAAATALPRSFARLDDAVADSLARITLSDSIGVLLITGALVAIAVRVRWRLIQRAKSAEPRCPRCRGNIHRVHRTAVDRAISWYVPVRRFRCASRECGWKGLRVSGSWGATARQATGVEQADS